MVLKSKVWDVLFARLRAGAREVFREFNIGARLAARADYEARSDNWRMLQHRQER